MADYHLVLRTPSGKFLTNLDMIRLEYTLVVNGIGAAKITIPPKFQNYFFSGEGIIRDQRIEINRTVGRDAPYLEDNAVWFVRDGSRSGSRSDPFEVIAYHSNYILTSRIVAYDAGSSEAEKTSLTPEAMIKEIIDENFINPTDTDRELSSFSSEGDSGFSSFTLDKAFARRNVYDVLAEIADFSFSQGDFLAFAVQSESADSLIFRTFHGQRGRDRRFILGGTGQPLVVGEAFGSMRGVRLLFDSSGEFTYVYAGGLGQEGDRVIGESDDSARSVLSPFNRRELFVDSRTSDDQDTLNDEAESILKASRPRYIATGELVETDKATYGRDFFFGDRFTLRTDENDYDVRLNALQVTVEGNKEEIQGLLRSDE